jgi:hypothetical protein
VINTLGSNFYEICGKKMTNGNKMVIKKTRGKDMAKEMNLVDFLGDGFPLLLKWSEPYPKCR